MALVEQPEAQALPAAAAAEVQAAGLAELVILPLGHPVVMAVVTAVAAATVQEV